MSATTESRRFFLALVPPAALADDIVALQQQFAATYQSRKALNSPPHITLQPPFLWPLAEQSVLVTTLQDFAQARSPVPVELDGFGAFPPRVIFLHPPPTPPLLALQRELQATCTQSLAIAPDPRPFRPHLTVAFRDLKPAAFRQAWPRFAEREFRAEFLARELTLLCHDGQRWQIARQFSLARDGDESAGR